MFAVVIRSSAAIVSVAVAVVAFIIIRTIIVLVIVFCYERLGVAILVLLILRCCY